MKFISEIEQQTYWLRTYHGYCIYSIPILKTRNQTLTLPFFSNDLIYLPGACFLAFSIPSLVECGSLVLEKTFEGFLPYMGVAAILVI